MQSAEVVVIVVVMVFGHVPSEEKSAQKLLRDCERGEARVCHFRRTFLAFLAVVLLSFALFAFTGGWPQKS